MNFRKHLDEFQLNTQNALREQERNGAYIHAPGKKRGAINVWTVFLVLIQRLHHSG